MKFLMVILLNLTFFSTARASCSCAKIFKDWKAAAAAKKYVFSAKLISVTSTMAGKKGIFEVNKHYRESGPELLTVYDLGGECEERLSDFKKETSYLFTAESFQEYGDEKNIFHPTNCSKSIEEGKNPKILKWLNSEEFKGLHSRNPEQKK